jgi:hypothetical protein
VPLEVNHLADRVEPREKKAMYEEAARGCLFTHPRPVQQRSAGTFHAFALPSKRVTQ